MEYEILIHQQGYATQHTSCVAKTIASAMRIMKRRISTTNTGFSIIENGAIVDGSHHRDGKWHDLNKDDRREPSDAALRRAGLI